jgi:hypothetical protein
MNLRTVVDVVVNLITINIEITKITEAVAVFVELK